MPIYECLTVEGTLDAGQRKVIAEAITTIHSEETGAPADLVHVIFPELPAGHAYTAGRESTPALIRGQVRAGRPPEVREAILRRIYEVYANVTHSNGLGDMGILVAVIDVPAHWVMEAGRILPEPDKAQEDAWFAELRATSKHGSTGTG
jgi:phenylpyruvate tautomerase PptA (4-oxalocrotonate tautomerase family)